MPRSLTRLLNYYRALGEGEKLYECAKVNDPKTLREAQRLHAQVYFAKGYVKPEEIDRRGILDVEGDPYQNHADYFAVRNLRTGKIVAASRLIYPLPHANIDDFQTLIHFRVYGNSRKYIHNYQPNDVREVSALVKARGEGLLPPLMLYRAMWQYSFVNEHRAWLIACNSNLYERLLSLFGGSIRAIGPHQQFRNHIFVPSLLEIVPSFSNLLRESKSLNPIKRIIKRRLVKFLLSGLSTESLTTRQQGALRHWHEVTKL